MEQQNGDNVQYISTSDYRSLLDKYEMMDKRQDGMELRLTLAEKDVQNITKKLDKIDGNTSKIIWLIASAIILAILEFILKGGLHG